MDFRPRRRPDRAGTVIQDIPATLRRSRREAVDSSAMGRGAIVFGREYAMQAFSRVQFPVHEHTVLVTLGMERTRQTLEPRAWPVTFKQTFSPGYGLGG